MAEPPKAGKPPTPPIDREDYDLTIPAKYSKKPPISRNTEAASRCPAQMMRDMGFDPCGKHMTPMQFLAAVMNDETDMLYKQENKRAMMRSKGIGMTYRIECAKTLIPYMNMKLPTIVSVDEAETKFGDELEAAMTAGNLRLERKTIIMETIQRISPDVPLSDANYPPVFSQLEGEVLEQTTTAEGDMNYNPDKDD